MSQTKAVVETINVPVEHIRPSPYQPRLAFNLEDIRGSIQRDGILVPLTARKKDGYYELVDGERRTRLAKELGYKTVPVTVINVDDDTARRMVWKVNTLRQDYTPKEKAYYFKKLQEEYGMSLRGIGQECDYSYHSVNAHLNVLKLPEKYQELIWNGPLSVSHIQELEPLFNGGELTSSRIIQWLDQVIERKLSSSELRETMRPELREIEERRIEAAKEVIKEVAPVQEKVKLETPEDFEEAATTLRKEAKRRREETLTPEEKAERRRRQVEKLRIAEERRRVREEEEKQRIEEAAKRRARELEEAERLQIEEEAKKKAQEEILNKPELIQKAVEKAIEKAIEKLPSKEDQEAVSREAIQYRLTQDEVESRVRDILRSREQGIAPFVGRQIIVQGQWLVDRIEKPARDLLTVNINAFDELGEKQKEYIINLLTQLQNGLQQWLFHLKGLKIIDVGGGGINEP
jgi:ParB family chromosome partitioning protein